MELQDWTIALAGVMAIKAQGDKAMFSAEEVDHAMRSVMHQMLQANLRIDNHHDHGDHNHPHTH